MRVALHVDMPRRIGLLGYDPEGLMLRFRGQPGEVYYDVPYATIKHQNEQPSFVSAQRFVALRSSANSFGVAALGGNQSFQVAGSQGVIAANLGASTQGRPDTRPQCIINPDGTAEHLITSGGDPFLGSYEHCFAVIFGEPAAVALAARMLRTDVALVRVSPGSGAWPTEMSLLTIDPDSAWPTAFRVTGDGCEIVVNDISGEAGSYAVGLEGTIRRADLGAYGIVTVRLG